MLQEARITFDLLPTHRLRSGQAMQVAAEEICRGFGGCTAGITWGCWYDKGRFVIDPSITFGVAIQAHQWPALRELAIVLAAGQETVYVVSPLGVAEVILVPQAPAQAPDCEIVPENAALADWGVRSVSGFGFTPTRGVPLSPQPRKWPGRVDDV